MSLQAKFSEFEELAKEVCDNLGMPTELRTLQNVLSSIKMRKALLQSTQTIAPDEQSTKTRKRLEALHYPDKVTLDIGGIRYATTLQNLQKFKGSFLASMFSGNWKLKPDIDGSYFIDRDGTNFRYILNYIRTGELSVPNDDYLIEELLKEAEFYQIEPLIEELQQIALPVNSVLLTPQLLRTVNGWFGPSTVSLKLLYRASIDGFEAVNFHKKM